MQKLEISTLEIRAKNFATARHHGQTRKYTGEPYINHPAAVVEMVRCVPHTVQMLATAWLHDVVEDTDTAISEIRDKFGSEVALMVDMLTDVSKPSDGNRAVRKAIDLAHIAKASPGAKTIKLADLIDNTNSIVEHDPAFAEVYLAEKAKLLDVLKEGNPALLYIARSFLGKDGRS